MKYIKIDQTGFAMSSLRPRQLRSTQPPLGSDGFTIIELLIATLVFSIIMLIITVGVLDFTAGYYKGVNSSTTQNAARSISDAITQDIQVSGGATNSIVTTEDTGMDRFCAGGNEYTFAAGVEYTGAAPTSTNPGLYVHPQNSGCSLLTVPPQPNQYTDGHGRQLLPAKMRIAYLTISGTNPYVITVHVAYGESDLLCSQSAATTDPNSCQYSGGHPLQPGDTLAPAADLRCRLQTGSQFCAVSNLTTTISRRVTN